MTLGKRRRSRRAGLGVGAKTKPKAEVKPALLLEALISKFRQDLYIPDPSPLLVTLGTVAANRLGGDPVWLLLVGPPGSLKSEIISSLGRLPDTFEAATLTEAGLLSGTMASERTKDATGGLLCELGEKGIITSKDFTSALSMASEKRAALFAAFREIYDGSWSRALGTDGGKRLTWQGKAGFIGGVTSAIDRHHTAMSTMGERFILYRMPSIDEGLQAESALKHAESGPSMRKDLAAAVSTFFGSLSADPMPPATGADRNRLIALASLVARCRSAVERDRDRNIELIHAAETPGRLVIVLDRLRAGLLTIGTSPDETGRVLLKVGLDSMPQLRRAILEHLVRNAGTDQSLIDVYGAVGHAPTTVRRHLEDLVAHGVAEQVGSGKADRFRLSQWAVDVLVAAGLLAKPPRVLPFPKPHSHSSLYTGGTAAQARGGGDDVRGTIASGRSDDPDVE